MMSEWWRLGGLDWGGAASHSTSSEWMEDKLLGQWSVVTEELGGCSAPSQQLGGGERGIGEVIFTCEIRA